jgi:hypothetical protein
MHAFPQVPGQSSFGCDVNDFDVGRVCRVNYVLFLDIHNPKIVITGISLGVIFKMLMCTGRREQARCNEHKLVTPVDHFTWCLHELLFLVI